MALPYSVRKLAIRRNTRGLKLPRAERGLVKMPSAQECGTVQSGLYRFSVS